MSGSAFAVTHHAFSSGAGRTSDGNGSHASTLESPSYTKSVSWQHYHQIVSAELLIKFSKPRSMDEDSYAKLLGATLKPVSDLDNIVFKRSDGRSEIKGKDLLKIKNVTIEVTDSGKLVEQEVFQEMSRYLKEIENEATNS